MTDTEINIAIATACGWKWIPDFNRRRHRNDLVSPCGKLKACLWRDGGIGGRGLPNYVSDLNDMHNAEEALLKDADLKTLSAWRDCLFYAVGINPHIWAHACVASPEFFRVASATARQRAEAFLRVKGLWK